MPSLWISMILKRLRTGQWGPKGTIFFVLKRLFVMNHTCEKFPYIRYDFHKKCGRQSGGYLLRDILIANISPLRLGSITSRCFGTWARSHAQKDSWTREQDMVNFHQSEVCRPRSSRQTSDWWKCPRQWPLFLLDLALFLSSLLLFVNQFAVYHKTSIQKILRVSHS